MNLILCGYHCSGKTTIAKAFSIKYDYHYIDTDDLVARAKGLKDSRAVHTLLGEEDYRSFEKSIVHSLKDINNTIIATGGGVLLNSENTHHLKTLGKIIYLYVETETLRQRILEKKSLPNFIRESSFDEDFKRYIDSRKTLYDSEADIKLNVTEKSVEEILSLINQYRSDHGI